MTTIRIRTTVPAERRNDHTPTRRSGADVVDTLVLPGPDGSVAVRRHIPTEATSQPSGALIYIHGGGFTYGTLDEFEVPMRLIAEPVGIRTYVVEYQLAPEAKYPTQLDEIEYVVRWLFAHAADEGVDPAKIALGGDSAGGNMTCVLALKLRDTFASTAAVAAWARPSRWSWPSPRRSWPSRPATPRQRVTALRLRARSAGK